MILGVKMKKLFILLIFFFIPIFSVSAMEKRSDDGIEVIMVLDNGSYDIPEGLYIDLLVKAEDVRNEINEDISPLYIDMFSHIENIDYLTNEDTTWISYLAYVKDASFNLLDDHHMIFASDSYEYYDYTEYIIICFNETGDTVYISEPILNHTPNEDEVRYGLLEFYANEPYHLENLYEIRPTSGSRIFYQVLMVLLGYFSISVILGVVVFTIGMIKHIRRRRLLS